MDKSTILDKVEESIRSYKEQLSKHEGSTLSAMVTGAKSGLESVWSGLESLKDSFMENEKAQKAVDSIKEQMDKLESSIKDGDKKVSAKTVEKMEELLKECREKYQKEENEDKDKTA